MAVYFDFYGERGHESWVFRSRDNGKTWGEPALIGKRYNETGIAALRDGRVLAALRSEKGPPRDRRIRRSRKDVEHPGAGHQGFRASGDLIQLRDRRILLTYGERNPPEEPVPFSARMAGAGTPRSRSYWPMMLRSLTVVIRVLSRWAPGRSSRFTTRSMTSKNALATSSSRAVCGLCRRNESRRFISIPRRKRRASSMSSCRNRLRTCAAIQGHGIAISRLESGRKRPGSCRQDRQHLFLRN